MATPRHLTLCWKTVKAFQRKLWLYALTWELDPHYHWSPLGGNLLKVTKPCKGCKAEVQTQVRLTQNPTPDPLHYIRFLCKSTMAAVLHAYLLGDNTSVITIIRTITTKSTGGSVQIYWLRTRGLHTTCLDFDPSSSIYLPCECSGYHPKTLWFKIIIYY